MFRLGLVSIAALFGLFNGTAHAVTYTWNNTTTLWSTGFDTTPVSAATTALVFGGTADITATNDIGAATFTVNSIAISNTGLTNISPLAAANTLTFAGTAPAISIAAGSGATTISNDVVYSVATAITNGGSTLLTLSGAQSLGANLTFTGTGAYSLTGASTLTAARTITNNGTGLLTLGAVGMAANALTISGTGNTTISGIVSGTIAAGTNTIIKSGTGTLTLSNTGNTFTGNISLNAGTLTFSGATGTAGTSGNTITIANGTTIRFLASFATTTTPHILSFASGTETLDVASGTLSMLGNHFIGASATVNKIGSGTLTLGSSGTATVGQTSGGLNVNEGFFRFTSNRTGSVGNIVVASGASMYNLDTTSITTLSIAAGKTLTLNGDGNAAGNGNGSSVIKGAYIHTLDEAGSASVTFGMPLILNTTSRITLANSNGTAASRTATDTITYTIANGISGAGGLILDGQSSSTLIINGSATYAGNTTVANGTLRIAADDRLPTGSSLILGGDSTANTPNTLGVFDINGFNQTVAGLTTAGTGTVSTSTWNGTAATNTYVSTTLTGNNSSIINTATVGTPTFTLNLASGSQTFAGNLGGAGINNKFNFTKAGAGTFTLTGTSTIIGNTTVSGGTLAIGTATSLSAGSPGVTVASGAVLDLTAITGYSFASTQTLTVGRTAAPAADILGNIVVAGSFNVGGTNTAATATVSGSASFNSANLKFDLNNTPAGTSDLANILGNLAFTGTNVLAINKLNGPLANGSFALFTYTGTLTGDATNFSVTGAAGGRQTASVDTISTANTILLNISGSAANLTWVGNVAGNIWDQATTSSFSGATNGDNRFYDGDTVTFSDTGIGGTSPVLVTGALSPSVVTITGAQNYTFNNGGTGSITGTGVLAFNGTGTITLAVPVTVTGSTTLSSGTLTFATGGSIAGPVIVTGGTLNGNLASTLLGTVTVNGGTVNASATGAFTGPLVVNGGTVNSSIVGGFTGTVSITGGTFVALNPTGTAINNGSIGVSGSGILQIGNGGTIGDLTGAVVLSSGGTVAFNRSDATGFTSALGFTGTGNIVNNGTAALTLSTSLASAGNLTFGGSGNITVTGAITGTTSITQSGSGTLFLTGANSQTGAINVNGGTLQIGLIANAGAAGAVVTINGGTYRVTADQTNTQAFNIGTNGGTIQVDPGFSFIKSTNGFAGPGNTLTVTGGGTVALTGSGNSTVSNVIVTNNSVYRHTSTRYVVANTTPYAITVQPGSTLYNWDTTSFVTTNYFPYGLLTGVTGSTITLNGDGTPGVGGAAVTPMFGAYLHALDEASTTTTNSATSNINVPVVLATTSRFTLAVGTSGTRATTDRIVDSLIGGVSGPGGLIVDGDGNGTLAIATVAATYQGNTRVAAGILRIGLNNALPTGTTLTLGGTTGDNTPDSSGTFELNAFSQTVAGLATLGSGTANRIGNLPTADGALIVNYNGASPQTFSGIIGYTGFRNLTLTKDGTGTLVLTGVNLLTRAVSVANGTLALSGAGSINLAPTISVATGATFDVAGVISGTNFDVTTNRFALQTGQTLKGTGTVTGGVTTLAGATIAPGNGTGTLTVTNGVMVAANSTFKVGVFDGSTPAAANTGLSSGSTPANGTANNFLNITGGGATFDPAAFVTIDGSTATFTGGDYSFKVAQGAGTTPFTINTQSQFTAIGFTGSNYSLTGDSSGNVFLNFTTAAVPEPSLLLGFGALGLGGVRWLRRRSRAG